MKQSQTKELTNQLSAAFSALIQHLWIKHRPSKSSLISSFWYLIFLIANCSIIAGLAFLFLKSDPDMAKLIISTKQDSSTSSFWSVVSAIGSLLAGLGTVGLLAFGWVKGNEWIRQVKASKRLDLISETIKELSLNSYEFYKFIRMNSKGESRSLKLLRLADTKAKLDFNIKTSVVFSANALNPDMSFPQFLVHIERQLDILGVCLSTLICFVLQDDPSYKHLDHCNKKLRSINSKLNELKANQHLSEDISHFFDEILFLNLDTGKLYRSLVDNEIK